MTVREACCQCGQLRLRAEGEPLRVSVCHWLACQRRSGSPFAVQGRYRSNRIATEERKHGWATIRGEVEHYD